MRIILSNIGTMGDINPLIAIALELKRRGHQPVMAVPPVYGPRIVPLGLEFHPVRPDIDPGNTALAAMIYDVRKGTERGLREFLFPALRQTYDDLLAAATLPQRADLLLLGELNYAGPVVAEVTGIPWASYVLAPLSFFSAYDPPVLPMYPRLSRADKTVPGMGHAIRRLVKLMSRKWPQPVYDLRQALGLPRGANPLFDAKHSPDLVLALFSRVLGREQPDWPEHVAITGFCFYDADAGNAKLPLHLEEFLAAGQAPLVFTLGSAAVMAAGHFYEYGARAAERLGQRAVLLIGPDARNRPKHPLPPSICVAEYAPYSALFSRASVIIHQGRGGHHGPVPARRQAHAHHALQPRSARQCAPDAAAQGGQGHPEAALYADSCCAQAANSAGRANLCPQGTAHRRAAAQRRRRRTCLQRA